MGAAHVRLGRHPRVEPPQAAAPQHVEPGAVARAAAGKCHRPDPDRGRVFRAVARGCAGYLALPARAVVVAPDVAALAREPRAARVDDHLMTAVTRAAV